MEAEPRSASAGIVGLDAAPGGLCLVQALINTELPHRPDPLDEVDSAQVWLDEAVGTWSRQTGQLPPPLRLARDELAALRDLRQEARDWLSASDVHSGRDSISVTVSVTNGRATYRPEGAGVGGLRAMLGMEVLLASAAGTLTRLKTCRNPACGAAFYDVSRNTSRVWHDVRTCGNTVNLRASRARRRPPATSGGTDTGEDT